MKNTGSTSNIKQMIKAMSGRSNICPTIPAMTGFGRVRKALKSSRFIVNPNSNINRVSMGSTIQTVFMIRIKKSANIRTLFKLPEDLLSASAIPHYVPYVNFRFCLRRNRTCPVFPAGHNVVFPAKNYRLSDKFLDIQAGEYDSTTVFSTSEDCLINRPPIRLLNKKIPDKSPGKNTKLTEKNIYTIFYRF